MKICSSWLSASLILILFTQLSCSKGNLDGVYERKLFDGRLSHKLIFKSSGSVEMTSAFDNPNLPGEYHVDGDVVTVTIKGGFSSKPTDFRIESDALIQGNGTRWEKIR